MSRLNPHLALFLAACCTAAQAQSPLESVEVIGQTPLGGRRDAENASSNIQQAGAEALEQQRALDLADFMKRNLASVFVNEAQGNPLQPDLQFRGFVGSPLLGLPQGLAVYQDGVRVNEPFGDTVNWALIPESAIGDVHLVPGSNPLFGLNALGGAIAIETKDGRSNPGTAAEVYGGSFSRIGMQVETGGVGDAGFDYFFAGSYLEEDGWRDFSPSEAVQLFGSTGWERERTSVDLDLTLVDTSLIGNGPAPVQLLAMDRQAVFTRPDVTENELAMLNVVIEHEPADAVLLTGNVYLRGSDIHTLNGDDSEYEECLAAPGLLCESEDGSEELVFDPTGNVIQAADAVEGATINRSSTSQNGAGFSLQADWTAQLGTRDNRFLIGLAHDRSSIEFDSTTELGSLDTTRLAVPGGVLVADSLTRLGADNSSAAIFISNTFAFSDSAALTVSGRYNRIDVTLTDRIGTALDGDHRFERFNPAIGFTLSLGSASTFYASYSEANRVPSPVELTCADENDPCRLPNAFLADPPLEQVVAETIEVGFRGQWSDGAWHAGLFSTVNRDDILFISAGALTNQGYFDNVGETRREGVELSLTGQTGDRFSWFTNYTLLDATFRERLVISSANNPSAVDGEVVVSPGDRLPLIPRQLFKAGAQAAVGARLTLGGELLSGSGFHMRGDEGNDVDRIGDYAVLNFRANYALSDSIRLFLNVDNVFDADYETFGLFGEPEDVLGAAFDDVRFLSPAAPRAAWIGIRLAF